MCKKINELPERVLEKEKQKKIFEEAKNFLSKELKCRIILENEEDSKIEKAKQADVLKPAIYLS